MRGSLREIEDEHQTFYGEFVRMGVKSGYKGRYAGILNPSKAKERTDFKLSHPNKIKKLNS